MGDPAYREKPQLHYAVSVPARTGDRRRPWAGLGGTAGLWGDPRLPRGPGWYGELSGGCCVRRAPQCPLPLRRGAPTLEPGVWELNLAPASGPGLRNGAPGAGPRFPAQPGVRRAAGTGWSGTEGRDPGRSQRVARGLAGKCASGCSALLRGKRGHVSR